MTLSDEYRQLAALIDALEARGITVREAAPVNGSGHDGSSTDRFTVHLEVELPEQGSSQRLVADDVIAVGEEDEGPDGSTDGVSDATRQSDEGAEESTTVAVDAGRDGDVDDEADTGVTEPDPPRAGRKAGASDGAEPRSADEDTETVSDRVDEAERETVDDAETVSDADTTDDESDAGAVPCTHPDCDRTFETERGMKIHRTKAHPLSDLVDPSARGAIHHDPEALAEVYDEYETFAEMTAALDVDVGAQAVRKQMIRHGIHEPEGQTSANASSTSVEENDADESTTDGEPADPVASEADSGERPPPGDATNGTTGTAGLADGGTGPLEAPDETEGVDGARDHDELDGPDSEAGTDGSGRSPAADAGSDGAAEPESHPDPEPEPEPERIADRLPDLDLPGSLSTEELMSAVETANTLYDVQRHLDLDRETTRDVLSEYDLLELVSGRAASVSDREKMKSEIHERLRRAAT
ncbi:hypothetical protein [Salinigranum marinum]|uniref:hypothetical protein n=1 Tax=Salinigranum marinum TaxID=1515595 RepID=UPI002989C0E2|nr:hypothetical protein [Salinigranum marinum]